MPWFRVDDSFYDHPKVFDAPDCAVALWVRAGTWSARSLTDGYVPAAMLARFTSDPETAARELVQRGLWSRVKGGYRFHDWGQYQPTRESVENERKAARTRMRRLRQARSHDDSFAPSSAEQQANFGRSSQPPSRPVQEPPNPPQAGDHRGQHPNCRACGTNPRGPTPEPPPTPTPPPIADVLAANGSHRVASEDVADLLAGTRRAITTPRESP